MPGESNLGEQRPDELAACEAELFNENGPCPV